MENKIPQKIQSTKNYIKYGDKLRAIDDAFANMIVRKGKNAELYTKSISRSLKAIFGNDYKVIVNDNNTMEFFGMQIYPKKEVITEIAIRIAENNNYKVNQLMELLNTSEWIIELDSKLFTDMNLKPEQYELTAAILHEIGHSLDKNSIANRIYRTYVIKKAEMNQRFKNLVRYNKSIFRNLFLIPIGIAFTCKSYRTDVFGSELVADKIPVEYGYGVYLQSFITKIIKTFGNSTINLSTGELDKEVDVLYTWIINNLNGVNIRQKALNFAIAGEIIKMPLLYMRDIFKSIIPADMDFNDVSNPEALYRMHGHDRVIQEIADRYTTEGLTSLFDNRRVKEVKQEDIDYIALEMDKIKTHDDRLFVMDLIYDEMDKIEASEDLISKGKSTMVRMRPDKIKFMRKQLEELRHKILTMKIDDSNRFGINIKYPAGYEG
nr:MAG TPA: peptidase [Caudoviricetes sp.]